MSTAFPLEDGSIAGKIHAEVLVLGTTNASIVSKITSGAIQCNIKVQLCFSEECQDLVVVVVVVVGGGGSEVYA